MSTPPATDSLEPSIATETVQSLRDFLHAAIPNISAVLREREKTWVDETHWERGLDSVFTDSISHSIAGSWTTASSIW